VPVDVPTADADATVLVVWWNVASAVDVEHCVSSVLVGMNALKVAFVNTAFHIASHAVLTEDSLLLEVAIAFTDHGKFPWSVPEA
jgi:hypothetical protein